MSELQQSLERHQLDLSREQCDALTTYCRSLWEWNEKLNLTRHLDYDTFVARDVIDSMQLAEVLTPNETVLDVGSGGGVPGVILGILRPDVHISLCDSIQKKTRALEDIVARVGIDANVITGRVQDLLPGRHFDTLVARAVGPLPKLLRWTQPHWDSIGRLVLIKGPRWVEERSDARHRGLMKGLELRKLKSYPMPGTESESVILSIQSS